MQDENLAKIQDALLDVDVECLKNAPGFDKNQGPNMADATWNSTVCMYSDSNHLTVQ